MSEEEFRKIAKEYAEMYFTKGIDSTKIFNYVDELEKKVKQLEKEVNEYQKELEKADSITQSCIFQGKQESKISFRKCLNKLEQLENIRKDAIEYINNHQLVFRLSSKKQIESWFDEFYKDLLNILNKGDNNVKDKR